MLKKNMDMEQEKHPKFTHEIIHHYPQLSIFNPRYILFMLNILYLDNYNVLIINYFLMEYFRYPRVIYLIFYLYYHTIYDNK
jgi:hypothetical protein